MDVCMFVCIYEAYGLLNRSTECDKMFTLSSVIFQTFDCGRSGKTVFLRGRRLKIGTHAVVAVVKINFKSHFKISACRRKDREKSVS